MSARVPIKTDATMLDEGQRKRLIGLGVVLAGAGVLAGLVGWLLDHQRFAFAYLTGFAFVVTIGLGALFFIILQHHTKAGWSVAARRHAEWIATVLPACIVLFVPVVLFGHTLYHEWMGPEAAHDPLLLKKAAWLNEPFFYARSAFYLAVFALLAWWFGKKSSDQDVSGDPQLTVKMQILSGPMMLVYALTLSFAAFDWLMSLSPHWYSTIFGVYIYSGSFTSGLSVLALVTIGLQRKRLLQRVSTMEHMHDIGKLMFAFVVFWAYIAFSQFMLIWYANMPEETIFYRVRWTGAWRTVSLLLIFGHFVIPFCWLMSRYTKRNFITLGLGAVLLIAVHYIDMYWLVMPTLGEHWTLDVKSLFVDLCGLLAPAGVLLFVICWRAGRGPLYPLKDPRLEETYKVVNL